MESSENIKIGINNIDLLVVEFVKFSVASFIHQSQVGIKYILNNIHVDIHNWKQLLLKSWMQKDKGRVNCLVACSIKDSQPLEMLRVYSSR